MNNAKALSVDAGSIEAGKLADLVVVGGDPLVDIKNARNIGQRIWAATSGQNAQGLELAVGRPWTSSEVLGTWMDGSEIPAS